ncbi:t-SNARE family protein [Tieghemostelium lacteum]|uniref:t-SNARE family protein n=1 Tax=Tieghemostelium lacteum TaxID=361077 RepID=A0A151ZFZ4_TIELA|nr:t-SNARE family protein [Tieghemostelium lacteum]|eukprot:KYQ92847.1 t-SNARE family protein [Tieghemostelium lacteum]
MVYKDRTSEFSSLAETIKRKQQQNGVTLGKNKIIPRSQISTFAYAAAKISQGVHETSEKLLQLTNMAKNTDLFMDSSTQMEELTYVIKQDIQSLNREIRALESISKSSSKANKQTEDHSDTIVGFLNLKLVNATKDFKDILEVRTESIKQQQEKLDSFTGQSNSFAYQDNTGSVTSPKEMLRHRSNTNTRDDPYRFDDYNNGNSNNYSDEHSILMPQEMIATNHTAERLRAAEGIASTIHQLEGIFSQLANLVASQNDTIERIDTNIDNSLVNISRGHDSLVKTLANISSNRGLIIKTFLVLIVFLVIFIVFMA